MKSATGPILAVLGVLGALWAISKSAGGSEKFVLKAGRTYLVTGNVQPPLPDSVVATFNDAVKAGKAWSAGFDTSSRAHNSGGATVFTTEMTGAGQTIEVGQPIGVLSTSVIRLSHVEEKPIA